MRMVATKKPEFGYGSKQMLIIEFMNMNVDCVELLDFGDRIPDSFVGNFNAAARKMRVGCRATRRRDRVFILRDDVKKTRKEESK